MPGKAEAERTTKQNKTKQERGNPMGADPGTKQAWRRRDYQATISTMGRLRKNEGPQTSTNNANFTRPFGKDQPTPSALMMARTPYRVEPQFSGPTSCHSGRSYSDLHRAELTCGQPDLICSADLWTARPHLQLFIPWSCISSLFPPLPEVAWRVFLSFHFLY